MSHHQWAGRFEPAESEKPPEQYGGIAEDTAQGVAEVEAEAELRVVAGMVHHTADTAVVGHLEQMPNEWELAEEPMTI